jgi:hypothetical protein
MQAPDRQPEPIPPSPPIDALKLPPGCDRWGTDLEKLKQTEKHIHEASNKTPEVVKDALSPSTIKLADRLLHPFTVQTYLNLEEIGSPFIKRKAGAAINPSVRDIIRTLWVMIEPDDQVERFLALGGDELNRELVAFASGCSMSQLGEMAEAIADQVARGFEPAAKMSPPQREGGGTPLSPASSATEPAGS